MADIGIMGGTFDPIHNGHLMLARQAYQEYNLDKIWFMPSRNPPHKKDHTVTDAALRCHMVQLAISEYPEFQLSDFEIHREGNTYTAETLRLLHIQYPNHRFFFIIGADSLYEIEEWFHPELVLKQAVILVAGREYSGNIRSMDEQISYLKQKYPSDIRLLHCQEMNISSKELRKMAAEKKEISHEVPGSVAQYIKQNGLYQESF